MSSETSSSHDSAGAIAGIAHKLRTPLTVIMSTVDNLMDGAFGPLSEVQRKWLKKLEVHTASLEKLLNDILEMLKKQAAAPGASIAAPSAVPAGHTISTASGGALQSGGLEHGKREPKILAVDDEPDILDIVQQGLSIKGFEVITAANGEDAVRLAMEEHPDLILMDVLLQRQNGMEICREIKSRIANFIPVILVTGQDDLREKISGAKNDADDLLTKPFQMEELYSRVTAMLRLKKLHDELERSSFTDHVTGAFNRRYLRVRLPEECARAAADRKPFSCLMLDLGNFKDINDRLGEAFGDEVLRQAVLRINKTVGTFGSLVRYEADRFVVVLPGSNETEAKAMGEQVRAAVAADDVSHGSETAAVNLSFWTCSYLSDRIKSPAALAKYIDDVFHEPKTAGGSR